MQRPQYFTASAASITPTTSLDTKIAQAQQSADYLGGLIATQ
jgi:hypothetical protein